MSWTWIQHRFGSPNRAAFRDLELSSGEQGLPVLPREGSAHRRGHDQPRRCAAGWRAHRAAGSAEDRGASPGRRHPFDSLRGVPASGLHRGVEWRGKNVGLPVPRLALSGDGRSHRRPRRNAARPSLAGHNIARTVRLVSFVCRRGSSLAYPFPRSPRG